MGRLTCTHHSFRLSKEIQMEEAQRADEVEAFLDALATGDEPAAAIATTPPSLDVSAVPLTDEGRESVVQQVFALPLTDAEQRGLLQHSLVVEQYLLRTMSNDATLTSLNLSHSFCTDVAMVALTDALSANGVITELILDGNPLTDVSAFLLARVLTVNRTLRTLSLLNVSISTAGVAHLADALTYNDTLTVCHLDTSLHGDAQQRLNDLLRVNSRHSGLKSFYRASRSVDGEVCPGKALDVDIRFSTANGRTHFMDDWGVAFLCACISTFERASDDEPLLLTIDLTGNCEVTDVAIASLDICMRSNASSATRARLCSLALNETGVTSDGVLRLVRMLEDEGDIVGDVFSQVPLLGACTVENCSCVSDEAKELLQWALSLRNEPKVVRRSALRLKKADETLLHLTLQTRATSASGSRENTNSSSRPASASKSCVADTAMALLYPMLASPGCVLLSLAVPNALLTEDSSKLIGVILRVTPSLQVLDLRGNERLCLRGAARHIAESLMENRTLVSLNMKCTGIDCSGGEAFATSLKRNNTLSSLDVSCNPAMGSQAGNQFLAICGSVNTTLRVLHLNESGIDARLESAILTQIRDAHEPPRLRAVLALLHGNGPSITSIDLRGAAAAESSATLLRDASIDTLALALRAAPHLTSLDVALNAVSCEGMKVLLACISEGGCGCVKHLDLSGNPVSKGAEFAGYVVDFLRSCRTIEHLDISNTELGCVGVQCILDAFLREDFSSSIQTLCVNDNHATPQQVSVLGAILHSYRVGAANVRLFARSLWGTIAHANSRSPPARLATVNAGGLCGNAMLAADVVEIVCTLLSLCTLGCRRLILSRNFLTDACAATLCEFVGRGLAVTVVDLRHNLLTDSCAASIRGALLTSPRLRTVDVSKNPNVSEASLRALSETQKLSQQPQFLKSSLASLPEGGDNCAIDFSSRQSDHLTDERFRLLCESLRTTTAARIGKFNFANNHVTNTTLRLLLDHMSTLDETHRSSLHTLSLKNTLVRGVECASLLAQLFAAVPSLTSVDVSGNNFFDEQDAARGCSFVKDGLPLLRDALETFDHIRDLRLDDSDLPEAALEPIQRLLELNRANLKPTIRALRSNDATLVSLSLSEASLTSRNVTDIICALRDNTSLRDLDLSGNSIGGASADQIIQWIGSCDDAAPQCSGIQISKRRRFPPTADMSTYRAQQAPACVFRIVTLILDNNLFEDTHLSALREALRKNTTLRCVSLLANRMTPDGLFNTFVAHRDVFESNDVLTELAFDSVGIDVFAYERFSCRFTLNEPTLKAVKLLLPKLRNDDAAVLSVDVSSSEGLLCDTVCYELSECLTYNTHVASLTLRGGCITDEGVVALCRCLAVNRSVTSIDLTNNTIGDVGMSALVDILAVNPRIASICLAENPIGAVGMGLLQRTLLINHTVTHVGLDRSRFSDRAIGCVDEGMLLNRSHPALKAFLLKESEELWTSIDVANAKTAHVGSTFDDAACVLLCDSLRDNTTVETLSISGNDLTFESCSAISELLQANKAITSLDASHNPFGAGLFHFAKGLEKNDAVVNLNVSECSGPPMYLSTIDLLVKANRETTMLKQEALEMLEAPGEHRLMKVTGELHLPTNALRPRRRKLALDSDSMPTVGLVLDLSTSVQHVDFSYNVITTPGLRWLCEHSFPQHQNISSLMFAHNRLTDDAVDVILDCASTSLPLLRRVDLSYNLLTSGCLHSVMTLLETFCNVEFFAVEGNADVSQAAQEHTEFLELVNQRASEVARPQLIAASHAEASLVSICLDDHCHESRNRLTDAYLALVRYALRSSVFVRTLCLSRCLVGDELLQSLSSSIFCDTAGRHLEELDLSHNAVQDCSPLVESLLRPAASRLRRLKLQHNAMVLKSARALASLLRELDTIEELDVSCNEWGRTGGVLIQAAISNSHSLTKISLESKGVPSAVIAAAVFAAASNIQDDEQRREAMQRCLPL